MTDTMLDKVRKLLAKAEDPGCTPEEAAGAVLFFCSPLSDFVTGEVLMCAGGMRF